MVHILTSIKGIDAANNEARKELKSKNEYFFKTVKCNEDAVRKTRVVKIYPVNYPFQTTSVCDTPPTFYGGKKRAVEVVTDHHSLEGRGLLHCQVTKRKSDESNFWNKNLDSPSSKLSMTLLVDLLERSSYLDGMAIESIVDVFGIERILQHMGKPLQNYILHEHAINVYVRSIVHELARLIGFIGRRPRSVNDFIFNFLFISTSGSELLLDMRNLFV